MVDFTTNGEYFKLRFDKILRFRINEGEKGFLIIGCGKSELYTSLKNKFK
jgi:hypothetical protein